MKCYTVGGEEVSEGKKSYAKIDGGRWFIKIVRTGPESGQFINPWSMWFVDEIGGAKLRHRGIDAAEYRQVSEPVFDLYIKFLQTQNTSYYKQAERSAL